MNIHHPDEHSSSTSTPKPESNQKQQYLTQININPSLINIFDPLKPKSNIITQIQTQIFQTLKQNSLMSNIKPNPTQIQLS